MGKLFNWSKTFVSFSVGIYFVFVTCFSFMNLDLDKNKKISIPVGRVPLPCFTEHRLWERGDLGMDHKMCT